MPSDFESWFRELLLASSMVLVALAQAAPTRAIASRPRAAYAAQASSPVTG